MSYQEQAKRLLTAQRNRQSDPMLPVWTTDLVWLQHRINREDWIADDSHQFTWLANAVKTCW